MRQGKFQFVDGVATADAAFEAYGESLSDLLASAAEAMFSVIVDLHLIQPVVVHSVVVSSDHEESLLFDWLSELVYLKDVNKEVYSEFKITIKQDGEMLKLTADIRGDKVDAIRDQTKTDVKAVTYHRLKIERIDTGLKAFVVLDL